MTTEAIDHIHSAIANIDTARGMLVNAVRVTPLVVSFVDSLPTPVWMKDIHLDVLWVNRAYRMKYGVLKARAEMEPAAREFLSQCDSEYRRNDAQVMETGKMGIFTEWAINLDGVRFQGRFMKFPVVDIESGHILGVGGVEMAL